MYIVHIVNFKINIWTLNLIDYENGNFYFEYFFMNTTIYISILKIFHLNFK
jgi:hypothetical protein